MKDDACDTAFQTGPVQNFEAVEPNTASVYIRRSLICNMSRKKKKAFILFFVDLGGRQD